MEVIFQSVCKTPRDPTHTVILPELRNDFTEGFSHPWSCLFPLIHLSRYRKRRLTNGSCRGFNWSSQDKRTVESPPETSLSGGKEKRRKRNGVSGPKIRNIHGLYRSPILTSSIKEFTPHPLCKNRKLRGTVEQFLVPCVKTNPPGLCPCSDVNISYLLFDKRIRFERIPTIFR